MMEKKDTLKNETKSKFPLKNLITAIICVLFFIGFFIFYTTADAKENYFLAVIAIMVLLMPIFIMGILSNISYIFHYLKFMKVEQYGTNGVCKIVDYKTRRYNKKNWNIRYALIVEYIENNKIKTYTTRYEFLAAEYRYLKDLKEIQCKYKDNLLKITEIIPEKIYENLTIYGTENSKFRRVFIQIWQIIGWIGAALMLLGIAITIILETNLYLIIGVLAFFIPTTICALIFGIHFLITFMIKGE